MDIPISEKICYVCETGPRNKEFVSCPAITNGVTCGRLMHPTKDCSNLCKACESYLCHVHKKRFKCTLDDQTSCDMRGGCCLICSHICKTCGFRFTWEHYSEETYEPLSMPAPENCEYCTRMNDHKCICCGEVDATINNFCVECGKLESTVTFIRQLRDILIKSQTERNQ